MTTSAPLTRLALAALALWALPVWAGDPLPPGELQDLTDLLKGDDYTTTVRSGAPQTASGPIRQVTEVNRRQIEERLPRSAPDALRFEPGVYVQQTGHGQGSAFIRGRTGQQTVILYDGIRMNNSLYRQGPNQYFFTIDSRTIQRIEVTRGSSSTLFGSDALGGAINALPMEVPPLFGEGLTLFPRLMLRGGSADGELGSRLQLSGRVGDRVGFIGGGGYRTVGLLRAGGILLSPATGEAPQVPRFAKDGKTQLGTGFDEATADGRVTVRLGSSSRLTLAAYHYGQTDAPRTDQCPPAYAPYDECLLYDEQFRTLAYISAEHREPGWLDRGRVAISYQRQHERRLNERPSSYVENGGLDRAHTIGLLTQGETKAWSFAPWLEGKFRLGGDVYHDRVESQGWLTFTDLDIVIHQSRGQYLDGASYTTGGLFAEAEATLFRQLTLRGGGRFAVVGASAPEDPESGTAAVDRTWLAGVGNVGLAYNPWPWLRLTFNVDQGFRAPNLDDLTSRQQTGPGFQFENAALEPERGLTMEAGVGLALGWLELDLGAYRATIDDAIARAPRQADQCPPETPQCQSSWTRFQLVNSSGLSQIWGLEGMARLWLPYDITLRATVAYAYGSGPNPGDPPSDPALPHEEEVPLSRIPPLNGTVEALFKPGGRGFYAGAALRWALAQDRLSLSDQSDERIPLGGTPGFAVVDLRAGYRPSRNLLIGLVFENITDAVYRYHGSSINGPGRSVMLNLEVGCEI